MPLKVIQNNKTRDVVASRIVAVASGKGGVGKSTICALLACALKRLGNRVGVLDADLYGPSLRHLLPEERLPSEKEGYLMPAISNGIPLLSLAFFQNETTMRAPIANQILKQFLKKTHWGDLDFLLIDFPPGTGDIPITLSQEVPLSALLVSTPQRLACLDVEKTITLFQKMKVPILGIVENMSYYKEPEISPFGKGEVKKLASERGIPFLGEVPLDPLISKKSDEKMLSSIEIPIIEEIAKKMATLFENPFEIELAFDKKTFQMKVEGKTLNGFAPHIQKNCPCAGCRAGHFVKEDVEIVHMERVGRYAVGFNFSSGCSFGIYDFDLLKRILI